MKKHGCQHLLDDIILQNVKIKAIWIKITRQTTCETGNDAGQDDTKADKEYCTAYC